jgi:hypothetical protein
MNSTYSYTIDLYKLFVLNSCLLKHRAAAITLENYKPLATASRPAKTAAYV